MVESDSVNIASKGMLRVYKRRIILKLEWSKPFLSLQKIWDCNCSRRLRVVCSAANMAVINREEMQELWGGWRYHFPPMSAC